MNAMRSFENGTLKMEGSQEKGMPPLNSMRVPMENAPAPHLLTQLNPERMYLLGDPRCNLCNCVVVYLCTCVLAWRSKVRATLIVVLQTISHFYLI